MEISLNKRRMSGVGIVELMVAMAIGLFLLAGLSQIYLANKQTYNAAEGLSRMQENLRFAAETVAQDVRMAGFMPCRKTEDIANVLNDPDTWWTDFYNYGVNGYDGDNTDDNTTDDHGKVGIPATFANHVANTDILVVLRGGENSYSVESHNAPSAQFKLNKLSNLEDGDIVMVCDLTNSAILQVTNTSSTNVTVVHNSGVGTPGNCSKLLGYPDPVTKGEACGATAGTAYEFGTDSHLVKFSPRAYYIGANPNNGRSLYQAIITNGSGTPSMAVQEIVEGIENMQVLYGVDDDGDNVADKYVRADRVLNVSGATWKNVVSVRLGFLAQTPTETAMNNDTDTYNIAGSNVSPDVADRKQRYQYNTTIKIRNRGAM